MADFWRAKVDVSNVTRTPALLDPLPAGFEDVDDSFLSINLPGPSYGFQAIDYNPHPVIAGETRFYIAISVACTGRIITGTPLVLEWQVTETYTWFDRATNVSSQFASFTSSAGSNGIVYLNNVTLKIEKDVANAKYIITGLLGTADLLFSACPPGTVDLSLPQREFAGYRLTVEDGDLWYPSPTFFHPFKFTYVQGIGSVEFSQFFTYKNDMVHPYRGATLGTGDRGHWLPPPIPPLTDEFGNLYRIAFAPWWIRDTGSDFSWTTLNADVSTGITAGIEGGLDLSKDLGTDENRYWDLRFFFPIKGVKLDLVHLREHGAHAEAYIIPGAASTLSWQRSHDKGHTWAGGVIDASGGDVDSPSINWTFGKLITVWYNSSSIVQSFSSDLGESWGTPVALSITGTHPRHLCDPTSGMSWYFYCDADKLYVVRSGNYGVQFVDAAPLLVLDPITTQTVAAQLALDGSLLVSYLDGSIVKQLRSTDLGRSWGVA